MPSARARVLGEIRDLLAEGRRDEALTAVRRARATWPDDPLLAALERGIAVPGAHDEPHTKTASPSSPPEKRAAAEPLRVVADPPWSRRIVEPVPGLPLVGRPRLSKIEERRNRITDVRAWFERHGFDWPKVLVSQDGRGLEAPHVPTSAEEIPSFVAAERFGLPLAWALHDGAYVLALYERPGHLPPVLDPEADRPLYPQVLVVHGRDGSTVAALDFTAFRLSPATRVGDSTLAQQDLIWAHYDGHAVYVAHGHWTYAAESGGQTGYVTAVAPQTGQILWRSAPRVANARNFAIFGPYLVTGYGFTGEPDRLFVLRKLDGEVMAERRIRSAPEYIFVRPVGDGAQAPERARLFVRAYDRDYVFDLLRGPSADAP